MLLLKISIRFHDHEIKYTLNAFSFYKIALRICMKGHLSAVCAHLLKWQPLLWMHTSSDCRRRFYLVPNSQWAISKHTHRKLTYLHDFSAHMLKIVRNWPLFRWVKINYRASNKIILICLNSDFPQVLQLVRPGQQTTTLVPDAWSAHIKLFSVMLERFLIPKENNRWSENCVLSSEIFSDVVYNAWKESELITYSCIAAYSEMKLLGAPSYVLWPPLKLLTSFIHGHSSTVVLSLKLYIKDGGRSHQSVGQFLW